MKIIRIVFAFLLFAGTAWAADTDALLGTWHREGKEPNVGLLAVDMTFVKDGTFHGFAEVDGRRIWNYGGKWEVKDGWLYYDYTKSDLADIPVGTKDKDKILKITQTTLEVQNEGQDEVFERRGEK
jgi:hypothetical protein